MRLTDLLAQKPVLLADGATGTNLFEMGMMSGDPPEIWNIEHPDRILALHQSFVDAGADIILTNSFGGNRRRLALHKLDGRVKELNAIAARNSRKVADGAGRPVVVAGSVGPTGDLFAPLGPLTEVPLPDAYPTDVAACPSFARLQVKVCTAVDGEVAEQPAKRSAGGVNTTNE